MIDSNIIHVYAVGYDMIILNSFDAAIELCDKRSSIYSSRWVSTQVSESSPEKDAEFQLFFFVGRYFRCSANCKLRLVRLLFSKKPTFLLYRMGWGWLMSAMVYGEPWRERRRIFQKHFHSANAQFYQPIQMEFIRKMLPRFLDEPSECLKISRQ